MILTIGLIQHITNGNASSGVRSTRRRKTGIPCILASVDGALRLRLNAPYLLERVNAMRAFLIIAAMFVTAAVGVTLITSDSEIIRETWIIAAVTIVAVAGWLFLGRGKK